MCVFVLAYVCVFKHALGKRAEVSEALSWSCRRLPATQHGHWDLNTCPLLEQGVVLTTEQFHLSSGIFLKVFFLFFYKQRKKIKKPLIEK